MTQAETGKGFTFERHEKKYMLAPAQYTALMQRLEGHMQADEYGKHTICTLYYDTPDFAVIRRCREKPSFKEKLRLRSYGVPGAESVVYLELKKKLAGVTYKRRVPLQHQRAAAYMSEGWPPAGRGQIFEEIDWYVRQQPLEGKVVLCYDRLALFGLEDPGLRLTLDANLRWRDHALDLSCGDAGAPLLAPGMRLMEIKTLNALPCWLCGILSELAIYPTSFSKYGTVYEQNLSQKGVLQHAG